MQYFWIDLYLYCSFYEISTYNFEPLGLKGYLNVFVPFEFRDLILFNGYRYSLMDGFEFIDASEENKSWYEFSTEFLHMMLLNMPDAICKFSPNADAI